MKQLRRSFAMLTAMWHVVALLPHVSADELTERRFRAEAPLAWKELLTKHQPVVSDSRGSVSSIWGQHWEERWLFKRSGESMLWLHEGGKPGADCRAFVVNPKYAFKVSRPSGQHPWALDSLTLYRDHESAPAVEQAITTGFEGVTAQLLKVADQLLPELIDLPTFVVHDARTSAIGDHEVVEVHFTYKAENANWYPEVTGARVILDPRNYWCVKSYECYAQDDQGSQHLGFLANEYREESGIPVPVSYELSFGSREKIETRIKYHFEVELRRAPSRKEFTLTAFGLPEPDDTGRTLPLFVWFALLGLGLLGIGVWLSRRV